MLYAIYGKSILFLGIFTGVFGFAAPELISQKSNELVAIGVVIVLITLPVLWFLGKNIFNQIQERRIT